MTRSRASTWLSMRSMQRCTSRCSTCCCLTARCSALYSAVTCISCNISHQRIITSCHPQASHSNPDRHVGHCEPAAASLLGLCSAATCNIIIIYICFAIISGSGMCDTSQLPPDRLVLSITSVVVQLELLDIRQHNIVPYIPRLSTQHKWCMYLPTCSYVMTLKELHMSQSDGTAAKKCGLCWVCAYSACIPFRYIHVICTCLSKLLKVTGPDLSHHCLRLQTPTTVS